MQHLSGLRKEFIADVRVLGHGNRSLAATSKRECTVALKTLKEHFLTAAHRLPQYCLSAKAVASPVERQIFPVRISQSSKARRAAEGQGRACGFAELGAC